ncbi:hypothetical protein Tco_0954448, partial [Tanacetum coccineum]
MPSHYVKTIKIPYSEESSITFGPWKMEHYLSHTDYPIWEVIQKGNGPVSVSTDTNGVIKVLPPKTAEEILARERERKARTTLLMALPEDHLAKFHKMTDAKEMWDAIKSRFGGNDESKKMQKYILKQQFEGFSVSPLKMPIKSSLGLYLLPGPKVFESDVKGSTGSSSSAQNVAFLDEFDLEEMDLKWQVAMISMRLKKFYKKTGRRLQHFARECRSKRNQESRRRDAGNTGYRAKDNGRRPRKQEEPKALVTLDGEGVDWTGHTEDEQENFALMADSNSGLDIEVTSCLKECVESYAKLKKLYDEQREQLGDASIEIQAYTQSLKKVEAQLVAYQKNQLWYEKKIRFMKINLDDKTDVLTYHKKLLAKPVKEKEELKTKLENFQSSSKGLSKLLNSQMRVKDKSGLGYGNQVHKGVLSYKNEVFQSVFDSRSSDVEDSLVHDRFANVEVRRWTLDDMMMIWGSLYSFLRATYGAKLVSASRLINIIRPKLSTARLGWCCSKVFNNGVDAWIGSKMQFGLDLRFWNTASSQTVNDEKQIHATIDSKAVVVTEASIRSSLLLNDVVGSACLTNEVIFQNLAL